MLLVLTLLALGCHSPKTGQTPVDTSGPAQTDSGEPTPSIPQEPVEATVVVSDGPVMVLEKRFAIELSAVVDVTMSCVLVSEPAEEHVLFGSNAASYEFKLFGILAEEDYNCSLSAGGNEVWSDVVRSNPIPFIGQLPEIVLTGTSWGHYTLFNHWQVGNQNGTKVHRLLILDPEGRLRWYWPLLDASSGGIEGKWQGGAIVVGGGRSITPKLLTLSGDVIAEAPPPLGAGSNPEYHHDVGYVEPSTLVGISSHWHDVDGLSAEGFTINAFDTTTNDVLFSWDSDQGYPDGGLVAPSAGNDPWHANAIQWVDDADGAGLIVSMKRVNTVMRVDRLTGDIAWSLGAGRDFRLIDINGDPLGDEERFYDQHGPELLGNRIVLYDNGTSRGGPNFTRVVEYELDTVAMTATKLWHYTEEGWYEPVYGDADRLPNGNVMVASGNCTGCVANSPSFIAEIDPSVPEVVWRMQFTDTQDGMYRAQRLDGCDLFANRLYCPE